jgi:hypothetical protein
VETLGSLGERGSVRFRTGLVIFCVRIWMGANTGLEGHCFCCDLFVHGGLFRLASLILHTMHLNFGFMMVPILALW